VELFGLEYETVPLDDRMRVRVEDYRREAGSIVIANANAPPALRCCALRSPACSASIPASRW
jgi:hypothetical protein